MASKPKLKKILVAVFLLLVELVLLALGTWQLYRLQYKTQLIAQINKQVYLPAISSLTNPVEYYRRVELVGKFLNDKAIYVYTLNDQGKPGYDFIIPFQLTNEEVIIVNCGWTSDKFYKTDNLPVELKGVVVPVYVKNKFVPDNDLINNKWYHVNLDDLAEYTDLKLLPAQVMLNVNPDKLPVNIRNDHLGYVLIWYSLAIIYLVIVIANRKNRFSFNLN